jgi:hypothetical protein
MTHLSSHGLTEFETITKRLKDNNIPYHIEMSNNIIINLETDDIELINYAKNNNPNLVNENE